MPPHLTFFFLNCHYGICLKTPQVCQSVLTWQLQRFCIAVTYFWLKILSQGDSKLPEETLITNRKRSYARRVVKGKPFWLSCCGIYLLFKFFNKFWKVVCFAGFLNDETLSRSVVCFYVLVSLNVI